jgi:hypothetical protein
VEASVHSDFTRHRAGQRVFSKPFLSAIRWCKVLLLWASLILIGIGAVRFIAIAPMTYTVGEIGEEPGYAKGVCSKELE